MSRRRSIHNLMAQAAQESLAKVKPVDGTGEEEVNSGAAEVLRNAGAEASREAGKAKAIAPYGEMDFNLCPRCFGERLAGPACPRCGHSFTAAQSVPRALPAGMVLENRYVLGEVLADDNLGIAYRAFDRQEKRLVDVWEHLPRSLAERANGQPVVLPIEDRAEAQAGALALFLAEGSTLVQMRHEGILPTLASFAANGTGYYIIESTDASTLAQRLAETGGALGWEDAHDAVFLLLEALHFVHGHRIFHGAVSPTTILLPQSGRMLLAGFGALLARGSDPDAPYTAPEFVQGSGPAEAWTDVYSVGATIYHLLTGAPPPPARDRTPKDDLRPLREVFEYQIPRAFSDCIAKALALHPGERWQSAEDMRRALARAEQQPLESVEMEDATRKKAEQDEAARRKAEQEADAKRKAATEARIKAEEAAAAKEKAEEEDADKKTTEQEAEAKKEAVEAAEAEVRKKAEKGAVAKKKSEEATVATANKKNKARLLAPAGGLVAVAALAWILLSGGGGKNRPGEAVQMPPGVGSATASVPVPQAPTSAPAQAPTPATAPPPATDGSIAQAQALLNAGDCLAAEALLKKSGSSGAKAMLDKIRKGHASVTIMAIPWGNILVDGTSTGKVAPTQSLRLPSCGKHVISLENPSVPRRSVTIDVKHGQNVKLSFDATSGKVN